MVVHFNSAIICGVYRVLRTLTEQANTATTCRCETEREGTAASHTGRSRKVITMANVLDVAQYILERLGSVTTWKLQKLVYYSQAWSLVWDEKPIFQERIEAWANGPVCPDLYQRHRGMFKIDHNSGIGGDRNNLDGPEIETIDAVLKYYGDKTAQWLSDLTHSEDPWIRTRGDIPPRAYCTREITLDSMAEYYGALPRE
jgi:uncharacterized phage-associated protein